MDGKLRTLLVWTLCLLKEACVLQRIDATDAQGPQSWRIGTAGRDAKRLSSRVEGLGLGIERLGVSGSRCRFALWFLSGQRMGGGPRVSGSLDMVLRV